MSGVLFLDDIDKRIRGTGTFPNSFLIEALAQLSVVLVQLESKPLEDEEIPLLGSINFSFKDCIKYKDESIRLVVKPLKITNTKSIIEGYALVKGKLVCKGHLGVAKVKREEEVR
ncbi:hotdog family protein [Sutcliffiella rhizosphaerae]|uniref:Uncharacterized protein n=1 Tax=Sutcliffiella rhizosphaerae TaxID=2880967 RepID=A0ABN8AJQ7_9BACI|nr:hypothetical protein [Sutcliffiella rhizosphaerae]CAG9623403.1 hypothetical protein BACCIP111883_04214 [Sutcliffiella rhizosphaerae]